MNQELILVTGASSYLGLHIVNIFLGNNFKVRGTIRSLDKHEKIEPLFMLENSDENLEIIEADLLDDSCWSNVLKDVTHVIHCASPHPKRRPLDDDYVIRPAVEGLLNVLTAAHESKTVKRFVLTSGAVTIMGYNRDEKKYDENDMTDASKHLGYVKSKILSEELAWEFVERHKPNCFELVVINPAFLLGPTLHVEGTETGTSEARLVDLLNNKPDKIPKFNFGVCDVRDAALAHFKATFLPNVEGRRFIIASRPEFISMKEICNIINDELKDLNLNLPKEEEPNGYLSRSQLDNSRMINELGIEPTMVKKTICDMVMSLIENGFINSI